MADVLTIRGVGTAVHVTTQATTPATGALITSGGVGITKSLFSGGQLVVNAIDTVNSAVADGISLAHQTTGSTAVGIGAGISVWIEDATDIEEIAAVDVVMTDVTNGGEHAKLQISTVTGGSVVSSLVSTGIAGLASSPTTNCIGTVVWTFTIASQAITASTGVAVTQAARTATLRTQLLA